MDEAVQVYQDMQRSMTQRWEDFTQREEFKAAGTKVTEFKDAVVETVKGLHDNEKFRYVVDKTKESVAELTGRLGDTWKKVIRISHIMMLSVAKLCAVKEFMGCFERKSNVKSEGLHERLNSLCAPYS